MNGKLIYVVDDEINICNIVKSFLLKEGFEVKSFTHGQKMLEAFYGRPADMLIIDIMMPELDGYSICQTVRQTSSVPIIFVSARDTSPDKIAGLSLGADDYITKPFSPMELVMRVRSIFRRIAFDIGEQIRPNNRIKILDICIDLDKKAVFYHTKELKLSMKEIEFLTYLALNKHRPVSRDELLNKVWGFESEAETRATDDMVKRIRKKLHTEGSRLKIETVWGFGFKLSDEE
ncbi:response regulator transcription factor [Cellulosilyticum sp. I15G10I2]|uniref:response regulator transcription factor n=1 Tax=Cellulosilyticum sp. I15G10I2 TaxID=1892843 RepID=UPI00085BB664|nr:response regulator transcription factor [Cellulosilyticum sp. I15G10I2]